MLKSFTKLIPYSEVETLSTLLSVSDQTEKEAKAAESSGGAPEEKSPEKPNV
jgi:hypothetical protein